MAGVEQKILIVDDESGIRSLLKCALTCPGRKVFDADCADSALAIANSDGPFHLVISDMRMPGMNGIQLATELRNRGAASAFLLISGYCEADALQAGMEGLGNCSFLAKPFSMPELLRAVGAILPAPEIRAASVRDQRGRSALRATRSPIDRPAALRRISARLHRIGQSALARADHATRRSSLQSAEMQRQTEWARELQETLERQRAMVKCYFGILGER